MGRKPADQRLTPRRCPTCGGMVYGPCVACRAKATPRRRLNLTAGDRGVTLGVNLHGKARERYEALKKQKDKEHETSIFYSSDPAAACPGSERPG